MPSLLLFAALSSAAAGAEPPLLRANWTGPEMTVSIEGVPGCAVLRGSADGTGVDFARAASDLRVVKGNLWIAQDDSAHAAVVPLAGGPGRLRLLFPRLAARFGRTTLPKPVKPDTEVLALLDTRSGLRLLAMGSGSAPGRDRVALIDPSLDGPDGVREATLTALYQTLDARKDLLGTDLNLEGAAVLGDVLRLFQRGNGEVRDGRAPRNAIVDIDLEGFLDYLERAADHPLTPFDAKLLRFGAVVDLETLEGCRLTFSGACELGGGWSVYVAAAERSKDAYTDGDIAGSAVGLIDRQGRAFQTPLLLPDGTVPALKLEGVAVAGVGTDSVELRLCADQDEAGRPSPMLRARLAGPLVRRALAEGDRP